MNAFIAKNGTLWCGNVNLDEIPQTAHRPMCILLQRLAINTPSLVRHWRG